MLVDVFLRKTAEKNAVETRVESVQVGTTHVTDARLGLEEEDKREKRGGGSEENSQCVEKMTLCSRTERYCREASAGREEPPAS